MTVHSILPPSLTKAVDDVLSSAGIEHVAHGDNEPVDAATIAAADPKAQAVIGPFRSRDVAEAVEATAAIGLPRATDLAEADIIVLAGWPAIPRSMRRGPWRRCQSSLSTEFRARDFLIRKQSSHWRWLQAMRHTVCPKFAARPS